MLYQSARKSPLYIPTKTHQDIETISNSTRATKESDRIR